MRVLREYTNIDLWACLCLFIVCVSDRIDDTALWQTTLLHLDGLTFPANITASVPLIRLSFTIMKIRFPLKLLIFPERLHRHTIYICINGGCVLSATFCDLKDTLYLLMHLIEQIISAVIHLRHK